MTGEPQPDPDYEDPGIPERRQSMATPRPVLIMNSVLAGLGVLLGGSALADFLPIKVVGLAALVLAAVQVGWSLYVQGQVVPLPLVAAHKDADTHALIAGPAAPGVASSVAGSTNVGDVVDVTRASSWE